MGREARAKVRRGNPSPPNQLMSRISNGKSNVVRFSDRAYGILRTGQYIRLRLPIKKVEPEVKIMEEFKEIKK